jgi:hypothetical protein
MAPGVALVGVALVGVALVGVALVGVALVGVALVGVALVGVAFVGVAFEGVAFVEWRSWRCDLSGPALAQPNTERSMVPVTMPPLKPPST